MISNAILSAITLQTYAAVDTAANVMAGCRSSSGSRPRTVGVGLVHERRYYHDSAVDFVAGEHLHFC